MTVRVGINGFGRIGRDLLRGVLDRAGSDIEVVGVNDVASATTLAHLLRYDSTFGPLRQPVEVHDGGHFGPVLEVGAHRVHVSSCPDPADLPWEALGADVVIESTGRFRTREAAAAHLAAGARKVVISAPGKGVDATIVMGVNEDDYDPHAHDVVSNASCTTNCVAPMVKVLHEAFGVRRGLLTTIHSYTNDQALLDGPHKDLRRARSAAVNMIPTSTGAAKAVGEVLPDLAGKLDGVAVRVPVENGSLTDLAVEVSEPVTPGQVNRAFAVSADGELKGILRYTEDPIVSRDIIGDPASCVFDASLTKTEDNLVKVFGWYDNEWGYSQRTLDLVELIGHSL
ncbi:MULTISPECIES: type I glyceraldehyde-3-phosphate dehydrogenase [Amycolatopsis]|uniref:Type I glyceraldehyde-3-phosphate dehydrogenase n=1 Tax=Amycolatopsis tucumanensis TaxID=401106 RepID=A0ABP7HLX5_9PSEU|nr:MULTISPECIES: type I glyceraldehyde-3-phosphate dehydrogenase [Amycolatopsis]MCF6420647.1 type I glyceraldehyde-3-phosphate dehydrogenase [Amycolatopsis tucumanensis]